MQTLIDWRNAKGWLLPEERELLYRLASEASPDARFLNVGTEYGASVACLRAGNPTAWIWAIDLDNSKMLNPDHPDQLYQGDSGVMAQHWDEIHNPAINLAFIDGDHGYTGVLADAKFADFVVLGGYILFQDCYDHDERGVVHKLVPGVNWAVSEWFSKHSKEFEELPYVGSTRVFKRVKDAPNSGGADTNL
jgi:cephalosporin hydroxylase